MKRRKSYSSTQNESTPKLNQEPTNFKLASYLKQILTVLIQFSLIMICLIYFHNKINTQYESNIINEDLSPEIQILYQKYDRNDDGFLDIREFEPLAHKILAKVILKTTFLSAF
jgi:hypothetical protein